MSLERFQTVPASKLSIQGPSKGIPCFTCDENQWLSTLNHVSTSFRRRLLQQTNLLNPLTFFQPSPSPFLWLLPEPRSLVLIFPPSPPLWRLRKAPAAGVGLAKPASSNSSWARKLIETGLTLVHLAQKRKQTNERKKKQYVALQRGISTTRLTRPQLANM